MYGEDVRGVKMNPEPLKGGTNGMLCHVENALRCHKGLCEGCSNDIPSNRVHSEERIKSAVEWLKEKSWIENYLGNERVVKWEDVLKAFEDAISARTDGDKK